jgi:EpsI family protein
MENTQKIFFLFQKNIILLLLLISSIVFLYSDTCFWLVGIWMHDKPYSHGFFIPLVSIYIIWLQRDLLKSIPQTPCPKIGGFAIISCFAVLLVGRVGAFIQAESFSLFFLFPAIILFLFGWKYLKALAFPLFYLQFMIPWTEGGLKYVYIYFQKIAAVLGTWILSFKYSVIRDGIYISLPNISMVVAEECSGINFLISVISVGLALVYLTQVSMKRAGIVLGVGILFTIIANSFRVAVAGVMGETFGAEMLHGPGHILRGWLVAWLGWAGLFLANWLVGRRPHLEEKKLFEQYSYEKTADEPEFNFTLPSGKFYGLTGVFILFGLFLQFFAMPSKIELKQPLVSIPDEIGSWYSTEKKWLQNSKYFPGATQEIQRHYRTPSGREVFVYIGYFASQVSEKRLFSYRSRPLLKGKREVQVTKRTQFIESVNFSQIELQEKPYRLISWFQLPSGLYTEPYKIKLQGISSAVVHKRNNGAIIILAEKAGSSIEEPSEGLWDFFTLALPIFTEHLR